MKEKKKVDKQTIYPNFYREFNRELCDYEWFIEFKKKDGQIVIVKAHKFKDCNLFAIYDKESKEAKLYYFDKNLDKRYICNVVYSDDKDKDIYDEKGNIINAAFEKKYQKFLNDVENVLKIGKNVSLLEDINFPKSLLRFYAVKHAILEIHEKQKDVIKNSSFEARRKDNIEKRREELQKIRLNKTTVEERTK